MEENKRPDLFSEKILFEFIQAFAIAVPPKVHAFVKHILLSS